MLAYVFWHAAAEGADAERYEQALVAFQRSLRHSPPFGFRGSTVFRGETPVEGCSYEDWYLIDDFAALGVLNEAAVGRGHRTSHDDVAHRLGSGTAGLYRLLEGEPSANELASCSTATWVARGIGTKQQEIGTLLGDGLEGRGASLWQRQLVLGPAPEFCLHSRECPAGATRARLAAGWTAKTLTRESLFAG
ncbi:MAG TPA: hypothetical protein VGG08_02845 [Solirubrobacteraceae bacterium]|jgi:hypothetical protein